MEEEAGPRYGRDANVFNQMPRKLNVILEAEGHKLNSWEDLQHLLTTKKVGDRLELLIGRDREQGKVTLTLEEATN